MSEKTLTRMDLSESVFREVGLSRNESADLVESVLEKISASLVAGEQVKIVQRCSSETTLESIFDSFNDTFSAE